MRSAPHLRYRAAGLLCCAAAAVAQQVQVNTVDRDLVHQRRRVSADNFSDARLRRMALVELARWVPRPLIHIEWFVPSRQAALYYLCRTHVPCLAGPPTGDGIGSGPLQVAELLSIGTDAVLRVRHADGRTALHPLRGGLPLVVSAEGVRGIIRDLAYDPIGPRVADLGAETSVAVSVFVQVDAVPDLTAAEAVLRAVGARLPVPALAVFVSADPTFSHDPRLPRVDAFGAGQTGGTQPPAGEAVVYRCSSSASPGCRKARPTSP